MSCPIHDAPAEIGEIPCARTGKCVTRVIETAREPRGISATAKPLSNRLAYAGKPLRVDELDTNSDLEANPDIAAIGPGPLGHYLAHVEVDSRVKAINGVGIQSSCESEMAHFFYSGLPEERTCGQPIHNLPDDVASEFEMPGSPSVAAYPALTSIVEPTRNNPDELPVDSCMLSREASFRLHGHDMHW
jgi:hypothetical protein